MIRVVCWNICRRMEPWHELAEMAERGKADVVLLQEAGSPPGEHDIGVSGIGAIAAARVIPHENEEEAFVAVSMYARWMKPHPSIGSPFRVGASDVSAHRILSDLSTFIGHVDSSRHRILAAGDLNMFHGATGRVLSLPERERMVWDRMSALGLELLGPQAPDGRQSATPQPDVSADTVNVPTYYPPGKSPAEADRQLDYAFASHGFREGVKFRALSGVEEWGAGDHCLLLIEVAAE